MNDENNQKLALEFPGLFPYGVWCGDGWFDIVRDMAVEVTRIAQREGIQVRLTTVEQKYGSLRVVWDSDGQPPDDIQAVIDAARDHSAQRCEETGRPGTLCVNNQSGWYATLAPDVAVAKGFQPADEP